MRDSEDFLLFGIEITTAYSASIIPKRFEDFHKLHNKLTYFWNSQQKSTKLIDLLPKLPSYTKNPKTMQQNLNLYTQEILKILQNPLFNKFHPWIKIINKFFRVAQIEKDEENKASYIQALFKQFITKKNQKSQKKFTLIILSSPQIQQILEFLDTHDLKTLKKVSIRLKSLAKQLLTCRYLETNDPKCKSLKTIDLSNSKLATPSIFLCILTHCAADRLQSLSLESSPHINDDTFKLLQSISVSYVLSYLNLNRCKLTDSSIPLLKIFINLKTLLLQDCKISDESIRNIPVFFVYLEKLDLSGTDVTDVGVNAISASKITNLVLRNCKNVNFSNIRSSQMLKIVSASEEFLIVLTHELSKQTICIKGSKEIQVRDICNFLSKKLGNNREISVKYKEKELVKYLYLISLPQENCSVALNFNFVRNNWPGLPVWIDKKSVNQCLECKKPFSWYHSKVNCRVCGKVVCSTCSESKTFVENLGYTIKKVPICRSCFKFEKYKYFK